MLVLKDMQYFSFSSIPFLEMIIFSKVFFLDFFIPISVAHQCKQYIVNWILKYFPLYHLLTC